ncbi:PTS sugar transporter subunit IIA [Stieleria varia]|uniref:PTS system fructose-specific EIIABC component n=1 Tax=Stieleria varia TaxID=2528005 RepID=A0A5C6B0G5_9BACT|nr:PTS sugar transporter subunit IIA [Stieleria varia]TWU05653.1 PTS system fructose-specific EIIABC component [Stieleria varia]
MKLLFQAIQEGSCLLNLDARSMREIVSETVEFLVQTGRLPENQASQVIEGILERERVVPTVIGHACAVPHLYTDFIDEPAMVFVRLKNAVNLGAPDGIATRYVFLLIGSLEDSGRHLDTLASVARLMSDNVFHFEVTYAANQQDVLDAMERHVNRNVLAKPPKPREVSEGLRSGSKPFAGIRRDLARKLPHYILDYKNGLRTKSIASIVFMFFACVAPAVTFGGLMGRETGGLIGAPEMLLSTAVCGILYAMFAGGPLIILGGIGPLLIFTIILYKLCQDMELGGQFLGVYAWVGLWTALMTVALAITNASNLMKYFTRFTDEIFSALMSLIFIYKAVEALIETFRNGNADSSGEKALLALVLAVGTFYIAMTLAGFRRSQYLLPWMREFLADFGPSIALGAMIVVAWTLGDRTTLDTLKVSTDVAASATDSADSSWMVDLWAVPNWVKLAAAGPAVLATVLVFLSQNITARLVNSPQNKIESGESYHWDLAVVGLLIGLASLFGWPWMVAATVRSLAHLRALSEFEDVTANSKSPEKIIHMNENRVTGIAIHVLIAGTLLVMPYLEYVPMATLYGIFLYMGFVSLRGIQFIDRLGLWLKDSALYPINHYTRRVPTRTIHLFTLVQLVCLIVLCVINVFPSQPVRILFPIFVALLVPVRAIMSRFFDDDHLAFLDADEDPDSEELHWV